MNVIKTMKLAAFFLLSLVAFFVQPIYAESIEGYVSYDYGDGFVLQKSPVLGGERLARIEGRPRYDLKLFLGAKVKITVESLSPQNKEKLHPINRLEVIDASYRIDDLELYGRYFPTSVNFLPNGHGHKDGKPYEHFGKAPYLNGTLTPFWAQEMIGADLAVESFFAFSQQHALRTVKMAIIDGAYDFKSLPKKTSQEVRVFPAMQGEEYADDWVGVDHGTAVFHLLAGFQPVALSLQPNIALLIHKDGIDNLNSGDADATNDVSGADIYRQFTKEQIALTSISMSTFTADDPLEELFAEIAAEEGGSVVVEAIGNQYPRKVAAFYDDRQLPIIYVGNLSPLGVVSWFSKESSKIAIVAPSSFMLSTLKGDKPVGLSDFGGTSGATPLVSGALNLAMQILGPFDAQIAKMLLQKSGMQVKGASTLSVLNAFRLLAVAIRLREKIDRNPGKNDLLSLMANPQLFDFRQEANDYREQAKPLLMNKGSNDLKRAIRLLRAAYLLSEDNEAARLLLNAYQQANLLVNAFYLRLRTATSPEQRLQQYAWGLKSLDEEIAIDIVRAVYDEFPKQAAALFAQVLGERSRAILDRAILYYAHRLSPDDASRLLTLGLNDKDVTLRTIAVQAALAWGEAGKALLLRALDDPEPSVRMAVVSGIDKPYSANHAFGNWRLLMVPEPHDTTVQLYNVSPLSDETRYLLLTMAMQAVDEMPEVANVAVSQIQILSDPWRKKATDLANELGLR